MGMKLNGEATPLHGVGRGFESHHLHHGSAHRTSEVGAVSRCSVGESEPDDGKRLKRPLAREMQDRLVIELCGQDKLKCGKWERPHNAPVADDPVHLLW